MRKTMQLLVLASVLFISSSAFAGTWTYLFGHEKNGIWTNTTNISLVGYCYPWTQTCKIYYSPSILGANYVDGVQSMLKSNNSLYHYYSFDYTTNNGTPWVSVDPSNESHTYWGGYWYYLGKETAAYNNWQAPGNCTTPYFMRVHYQYYSGGTMYERRFRGPSYYCIE